MEDWAPESRPRTGVVLVGVVVVAAVVGRLGGPVGDLVGAVGTVAHEAGHAAVADVLTGDVASITVFRDGGGVAVSEASDSGWRSFLVAAAGYPATLVAALALLTGAVFGRSSRAIAGAVAALALVALVLWTPFSARVPGIEDGDQRFTWFVLATIVALAGGSAATPARYDTARRVVLGALAVGLLSDAFRAGSDLVLIEDQVGAVATDADGLAEAAGVLSASTWAWLLRASLFLIAGAWLLAVLRWRTPPEDSPQST